jgi:hypothetical protein
VQTTRAFEHHQREKMVDKILKLTNDSLVVIFSVNDAKDCHCASQNENILEKVVLHERERGGGWGR